LKESIDFHGLPTIALENEHFHIEALAQAGPRLVRAFVQGNSENIFAEVPGLKIDTSQGQYSLLGGHRLCHAPEAMPRTYIPDDQGVLSSIDHETMVLEGPPERYSNIQKRMTITLIADRPGLVINQTLTNLNAWQIELACWGITQLPPGGIAILPQPDQSFDPSGLLPNRALVLWPYTKWGDARLELHDDFILVHAEALQTAMKIGYANNEGWAGYLRKDVLFVKRFEKPSPAPYPDLGCNLEIYANSTFLEMETLGGLVRLSPSESITLTETWEFIPNLSHIPHSIQGIRSLVDELGLPHK
jgi:hypothetical protein